MESWVIILIQRVYIDLLSKELYCIYILTKSCKSMKRGIFLTIYLETCIKKEIQNIKIVCVETGFVKRSVILIVLCR